MRLATQTPPPHKRRRRAAAVLTLSALTLALAGCAGYPRIPHAPDPSPALGRMDPAGYGVVEVLFATNRQPTGAADPILAFGADRERFLTYGMCDVSIPPNHMCGCVDEGGLFAGRNPARTVALLSAQTLSDGRKAARPDAFIAELRRRVEQSPRREILLFIHGYAATFDDGARRVAQIAHDIRFDGVPVLYSWPTQGLYLSYLVDGTNAEWTLPYFVDFLDLLVRESGAERIHLMAHSMGTRVLSRGLRDFLALRHAGDEPNAAAPSAAALNAADPNAVAPLAKTPQPPYFDQVILCVADIDAETFERDYLPYVLRAAQRSTLYSSSRDVALGLSMTLNGYFRLGQTDLPNVDLDALRRIDVVDVTDFDNDFFRHFYYHRSPRVLEDMAAVLRTRSAPDELNGSGAEQDKGPRRLQRTFFYRMRP